MNIEEKSGTTVLHHKPNYTPPASWRTLLVGKPLSTAEAQDQTIGKLIGLAVFASDALSSTAYSTQEMLVILAAAGAAGMAYVTPLTLGIVILLGFLTLSYEQTIHAYPDGGGAYIVARDNLGVLPAQVAAAALLTDYILTVAVSISSGVANIVSAFPELYTYRVWLAVSMVLFIMLINLRGVKEAGTIFAIPTYFFLIMMCLTLITGLVRYFSGTIGVVANPPEIEMHGGVQAITLFLILRAFSNGTTALTGVEAISNGITAFKEPRSKNAGITLLWMSAILGSLLIGIAFLTTHVQAVPSEFETVISQLARTVFDGKGIFYLLMIVATTVILVMAANTAFAGFPRLGAIVAMDGYLPRQMTYRGDRLVFSRGIVVLSIIASVLIVLFQASVTNLIPLYAIGVFLSFTLSQTGMARRWWKIGKLKPGEERVEQGSVIRFEKDWAFKMLANSIGAMLTFIVMIVFAVTKFVDGAWVVILIIPLLVFGFIGIHKHYKYLASQLSLEGYIEKVNISRHRVIVLIGGVHKGSLAALRYAKTLSNDITAVHVSINPTEADRLQEKWELWGKNVRLVVLESPYRLFVEPLLEYIEKLDNERQPNEMMTIVVPQFVSSNLLTGFLHTRTAVRLREVLLEKKGIVITEVPYKIE